MQAWAVLCRGLAPVLTFTVIGARLEWSSPDAAMRPPAGKLRQFQALG